MHCWYKGFWWRVEKTQRTAERYVTERDTHAKAFPEPVQIACFIPFISCNAAQEQDRSGENFFARTRSAFGLARNYRQHADELQTFLCKFSPNPLNGKSEM